MPEQEDMFLISDTAMSIYLWVVYGVVCQLINIFGIVTNIINIICFAKQGFGESVNISLLGLFLPQDVFATIKRVLSTRFDVHLRLALSDLGSLLTMVWTAVCFTPALMTADLSFDPMEVAYLTSGMAHVSFTRVSGCITAMITLERCLCITAPLKIKSIITPRRTTVITVCMFVFFFCTGSPAYAVNTLDKKYFPLKNKTLIGLVSTENRESVEMISFGINNFTIPFISFIIIFVCTTILSIQLRSQSNWRQKTITSKQGEKISIRNQKTAKMVMMISILFIVCFIPIAVIMLTLGFVPELTVHGKYINLTIMIVGFCYLMESINSSMNIFFYYHMGSRFREYFLKLFFTGEVVKVG